MATRQVLFIQGAGDIHAPDGSGVLASYLRDALGDAAEVLVPDMTDAENPRYEAWSGQLRTELAGLRDRPVLVGHSLGGSVLLRCLAERAYERSIAGLFLVSTPYWGPGGWDYAEFALPEDFSAASLPPMSRVVLYHSHDDSEVPFEHLARYAELLPDAEVRELPGDRHSFLDGLPELVEDVTAVLRGDA